MHIEQHAGRLAGVHQGDLVSQAAANYFRACAGLKSDFQATDAAHPKRIQTEYHGIK